jgi:hypothetical protein
MKGNHKPTKQTALAVLESPQIVTTGNNLNQLAVRANEELDAIKRMETGAALRAIRFGIVMYQVKATLPHGQFLKWRDQSFPALKRTQAGFYMSLALTFVEKSKANLPEVLALPEVQTDLPLDQQQGPSAEILGKAYAFVGDCSLNELLDKHGIKGKGKLGGARESDDAEKPIKTAEELAAQKLEEISAWLDTGKQLLVEENALQHLTATPETIRAIVSELSTLAKRLSSGLGPLLEAEVVTAASA